MAGFDAPYVPGWDCHGLPIEIKVDSELGARKAKMTAAEIRAECRKYAEKYVNLQRTDFKRLGVFGRWDDPYLTMSAHYQSVIAARVRGFPRSGLRLQRTEAGALVHARPHRAGRSRSRICGPFEPFDLGALRADFRSRQDRSRARRPPRLRPHLDDHALDHPGQHGHRVSSEIRIRSRGRGWPRSTSSPPIC